MKNEKKRSTYIGTIQTTIMNKLLYFFLCFIITLSSFSQENLVDSLILKTMKSANIPGIAIAKIDSAKVSWERYHGIADFNTKSPINKKSIFLISSVSKTITSAALMKLHGDRLLNLDDDINDYLDFSVRNPNHPDEKITFRQLLRHRSSIKDNYQYLMPFWTTNSGDSDIELKQFLKNYLTSDGKNYNSNFDKNRPNDYFNYSNVGFALIGLLIEEISGMPFNKYCEEKIFGELEMKNSKWFLKNLDINNVARQYEFDKSKEEYNLVGYSGFPDYPAGQLRTTLKDYTNFLITWMNYGKWKGKEVFNPFSIYELTPSDFMLGIGFHTWFLYNPSKEEIVYSHYGSDKGSFAFTAYNAWTKKGVVVFINSSVEKDKSKFIYDLINILYNNY